MKTPFGSHWKIPKEWGVVSLKDVTSDWRGGAPFEPDDFTNQGFPVLHKGGIQRNGRIVIDPKKKTFTTNEYAQSHQKSVIDKTFMAATLRDLVPSGPSIGLIADLSKSSSEKYILAQGAYGFQLDIAQVNRAYLVWLSNYEPFREYIKRYCVGTTQIHIRTPVFQDLQIPLPPIAEQKRIAAILDKAEELRGLRRKALEELDAIVQSIFLEMFGDPVRNSKEWTIQKFSDVGVLDRGISKHRPRNAPELLGGAYPLIQTGDVSNCDRYIRSYTSTYSEMGLRQSRMWKAGTLCITIAANIAKTGILTFDACFPDSVIGFQPNELSSTEYVQSWLSFLQATLEATAPESAQKNINLAILRNLDIPVPPINLQQEFAQRVEAIEQLKATHRESLAQLDALFASLQYRAFRGEL